MPEHEEPSVEDWEIKPMWSNPKESDPRPPRRAALCFLGEDILSRLLSLPEGWTINGVRDDFIRNGVMIRITGPTAPEAPVGSELWTFTPELEYEAPSPEELEANPHMSGKLRVILPDWLLEGDDKPWTRDR